MSYATIQTGDIPRKSGSSTRGRKYEDRTRAAIAAFIDAKYAPLKNASYHLAQAAGGVSLDTAASWLKKPRSGERTIPQGDDLMQVIARNEELEAGLLALVRQLRAELNGS